MLHSVVQPCLSSYRLGDLVLLQLSEEEQEELVEDHPYSLGAEFIQCRRQYESDIQFDALFHMTRIVLRRLCDLDRSRLPHNISESIVIHLRLGDVVAGTHYHEIMKRPLSIEELTSKLEYDTCSPRYAIGRPFFAKRTSSTNIEECVDLSYKYLEDAQARLSFIHFDSGDADLDMLCAIESKMFVQGQGFFSQLIVELRHRLGRPNILLETHDETHD